MADGSLSDDLVFGRFGAMIGHTHVDLRFPRQAVTTTQPISITFTLKIFHTAGAITILQGTPPQGFKPDNSYNFPAGE